MFTKPWLSAVNILHPWLGAPISTLMGCELGKNNRVLYLMYYGIIFGYCTYPNVLFQIFMQFFFYNTFKKFFKLMNNIWYS